MASQVEKHTMVESVSEQRGMNLLVAFLEFNDRLLFWSQFVAGFLSRAGSKLWVVSRECGCGRIDRSLTYRHRLAPHRVVG